MTIASPALQIEDRLAQLFQHLGIRRAHVGGGYAADAVSLARASPDSIVPGAPGGAWNANFVTPAVL